MKIKLRLHYINNVMVFFLILIGISPLYAQPKPIALKGGRLITISHGVVEDGTILMRDGRIVAVGKDIAIPGGAEIVDVSGQTIMPGLINGFTNIGLTDIPSFGKDDDEATSVMTPQVHVLDGLNPDNRYIPISRGSGVTAALCAPGEGNLLSGVSALIHLSGETVEEMKILFPMGVHGNMGEAPKDRYGKNSQAPMSRMGTAAMLRQTFIDALDYYDQMVRYEKMKLAYENGEKDAEKPDPVKTDLKLQALVPVVNGELPLIIGADRFDDIHTILRIADEFGLKIILNHGTESYRVADILAKKDIPVILGPVSAGYQRQETMQAVPDVAARLHKAGVLFAFQTGSIANVTGLLDEARRAVSHGLPREAALRALTLDAAKIFVVDDQIGSLEKNKMADIVVFNKDPLDGTARVTMVFIGGVKY